MPRLLYTIICIVLLSACDKNICPDNECLNGGLCVDGACDCPIGWTGDLCEESTDPCANLNCLNDGVCTTGLCTCLNGFTGIFCQTEIAELFVGKWLAETDCYYAGMDTFTAEIIRNGDEIFILNFNGYGQAIGLTADINLFDATFSSTLYNGVSLNGLAAVADDGLSMTWSYNQIIPAMNVDDCYAVWNKIE